MHPHLAPIVVQDGFAVAGLPGDGNVMPGAVVRSDPRQVV